jgi:NodT family efflux transporter outer membrane factor (OMF) lipoprotein
MGLAGCAAVGPNYTPPKPTAGTTFAMTGDAAPSALRLDAPVDRPWWGVLNSSKLDQTIRQAVAGSPTLAAADATLGEARQEAAAAHGGRYPEVTGGVGYQRERINVSALGFPGFPSPTIGLYTVGANVSYDLDLFGGERRRVEAADAQAKAAAWRAEAAYLTLTGQVAENAAAIADLNAQIGALKAVIHDDEVDIGLIRAAEEAGGDARSHILGGRAKLARDTAALAPLQQALSLRRHTLAQLAGHSPDGWAPPDFTVSDFSPPADLVLATPSTLVRRRPDIQAAEADLHAASARIGVATADLYPDVRVTAGITQEALTPQNLPQFAATAYNFGPQLSLPLFDGGILRARRRAAVEAAKVSEARYRATVVQALTEVADALSAVGEDDQRIASLTKVERLAQASLEDARNAYRLGGAPFADLVNAQDSLDAARRDLVAAQGQRLGDLVTLLAAAAGDWRETPSGKGGS